MIASTHTIARVEKWIWILAYGGLFALVLGIATLPASAGGGWTLITLGAIAVIAGAALVWVRSILEASR